MQPHRYFILNKPFKMVSQFISSHEVSLLGNLDFVFPEGTHAIGRLDNHSEGLLLLTTNKKVTRLLFQSKVPHQRTYLVQVKNIVTEESLQKLQNGILISGKGGVDYLTLPCDVSITQKPNNLFSSGKVLRDDVSSSWLFITLTEGKFHQVRKMVAAIHHRCIRLIRMSIEDITLGEMKPGEVIEIDEEDFFTKLRISER